MNEHQAVRSPDAPAEAILFAGWGPAPLGLPNELVPLAGRPLLQRAVEALVGAGCTTIHVVLGDAAFQVKRFLGDGERWGCALQFHACLPDTRVDELARRLALDNERCYALGRAAQAPLPEDLALAFQPEPDAEGVALAWNYAGDACWTGWGVMRGRWLRTQAERLDIIATTNGADACPALARRLVRRPLSVVTLGGLLAAHERALNETAEGQAPRTAARRIHPDALLVPPVHLGRNVRIGAGAVVGPHVSLGERAFIDEGATVANSIVMPGTYVGPGLELVDVVANGCWLANGRHEVAIRIPDRHLLAGSERQPGHDAPPLPERALAVALTALAAPLRALMALPPWRHCEHPQLQYFTTTFCPGLSRVWRGRSRLVGPRLRSAARVRRLPQEWQVLYDTHPAGLLNDAVAIDAADTDSELAFAADAVACAQQTKIRVALKLSATFFVNVLRSLPSGWAIARADGIRATDALDPSGRRPT